MTLTRCYSQKLFNITAYGAVGDGRTINTLSIQKAIDAATESGSGIVVVPKGIFVTASIELKSGVHLQLRNGAIIQGSDKRKDYELARHPALIVAFHQHNISISGGGIIDGKGRELMKDIFKRLEEGTLTDKEWKKKGQVKVPGQTSFILKNAAT